MPRRVEHEVTATQVRTGDVISSKNTAGHKHGAKVGTVKKGNKYVTAFEEDKDRVLFRVLNEIKVWVERTEPTEEELEAQRRTYAQQHAEALFESMKTAYPTAVARVRAALDAGHVPSTNLIADLYAGERLAQHAERLRRGMEIHLAKSLTELFGLLRDDLVTKLIETDVVGKWSGGFTIMNAREQIHHETDARVVRSVNSNFMFYEVRGVD